MNFMLSICFKWISYILGGCLLTLFHFIVIQVMLEFKEGLKKEELKSKRKDLLLFSFGLTLIFMISVPLLPNNLIRLLFIISFILESRWILKLSVEQSLSMAILLEFFIIVSKIFLNFHFIKFCKWLVYFPNMEMMEEIILQDFEWKFVLENISYFLSQIGIRLCILFFLYGIKYIFSIIYRKIQNNRQSVLEKENVPEKSTNLEKSKICQKNREQYLKLGFIALLLLEIIFCVGTVKTKILKLNVICIGIFYLIMKHNVQLEKKITVSKKKIEELKVCNENLKQANDEVRAFRHDFNNIMQAIGGYIKFNDYKGLEEYYGNLVKESNLVKNLSTINSNIFQEQKFYKSMTEKLKIAEKKGITINVVSFTKYHAIKIKEKELTFLVSQMIDRAIRITENAEKKEIMIYYFYDEERKKNRIIIASTYMNKQKEEIETKIMENNWKYNANPAVAKKEKNKKNQFVNLSMDLDNNIFLQELIEG